MSGQEPKETTRDAAGPKGPGPFLSIIIPTWNRAAEIRRCLDSVLGQSFADYEIVIVDGNSTDGTVEEIRKYNDARIGIIQESEKSGCWGARLLGVKAAKGRWIAFLDSDDEMTPGALGRLAERCRQAAADVGVIGATYRIDTGLTEPYPPLPEGPFGLAEDLQWLNRQERADYLHVIRREVMETTELPAPRGSGTLFELDVFDHWRKDISQEIAGIVHTDVANRMIGKGKGFSVESMSFRAAQAAMMYERVIEKYGERLRRHAPRFLANTHRHAGLMHMIAGHRLRGARHLGPYLLRRPADVKAWGVFLSGLIGPVALTWARRYMT